MGPAPVCADEQRLKGHIELPLEPRAVPDPYGRGPSPARQMRELTLGQVSLAADAEHDLQVAAVVERSGGRRGDVVEELAANVGELLQRSEIRDFFLLKAQVEEVVDGLGQSGRKRVVAMRGKPSNGKFKRCGLCRPAALEIAGGHRQLVQVGEETVHSSSR